MNPLVVLRQRVSTDELLEFARHYHVQANWLLGQEQGELPEDVAVAAREMAKLSPEDRDRILAFLKSLERREEHGRKRPGW